MNTINLAGSWALLDCSINKTYPAELPGSDFGNLIRAGAIKSPLISGKEEEGLYIGRRDFEFSRTFTLDESVFEYEHIALRAGYFDTLCTCYINGREAFQTNNAHIPIDCDIKQFLVIGENEIRLHFDSAVNFIEKRQNEKALPKNPNGVDGIPYIRKPACHFGWDWGPCVPYCAVGEYIELLPYNTKIENIAIKQNTTPEEAVITVSADGCDVVKLLSPSGDEIEGKDGVFTVENPELWYTYEMNGLDVQPLYTVVLSNGEMITSRKIGLRTLYLERSKDEYGENFVFVLNGERVFAKGANLIPFSAIPEDSDESDVDYYLDLARRSNFNMLRVWGGGRYADDYFMNKCDEMGILVWQDFGFACQMYPFYEEDFTANVLREVKANVMRMTTHPSLALWCGNNEIEVMFSYLPKGTKLVNSYREFFYDTLYKNIRDLTDVSYIPSSPLGTDCFKDNSADGTGDTHMWNVWHGMKKLDYYATRYTRFLSEFGLESLPSMKAIKTFAKPDEYSITSPSFNNHQKCSGGNKKMLYYITELFDDTDDFSAMPYLTGIVQAECVKNAAVHFRQNKGRCNGALFWQYNDVWNCPSWASVDFEKVPKALQYWCRQFFAPITFTVKKEKGKAVIFAHNDTLEEVRLILDVTVSNPDVHKKYTVIIPKNSYRRVDAVNVTRESVLTLRFNDEVITEVFAPPCDLPLEKAHMDYTLDGKTLTVKSDTFVYNLCIESDAVPLDNYFCLLPNEERRIEFDRVPVTVDFTCANNIEFNRNPLKKALSRKAFELKPENIANFFYYTFN